MSKPKRRTRSTDELLRGISKHSIRLMPQFSSVGTITYEACRFCWDGISHRTVRPSPRAALNALLDKLEAKK